MSNPLGTPVFEALWKRVLDHWDDEAAHRAFLEHSRQHESLAEAAARYRGMKGDHARGALAEQKLTTIAALALAHLQTLRTPNRRRSSRLSSLVLIVFFIAGTIGLLAYMGRVP